MAFIKQLLSPNEREIRRLRRPVQRIAELEPKIQALSDTQLAKKTDEFRNRLADGSTLDDLLVEAFAVVREAFVRTVEMRPFDVQMMGAIVLHQGKIAEMKTGEGKTLVAVMPLYLNALEGKGAHLVTTNDYLVSWQAEWMGQVFQFLGLTVGHIQHDMEARERREGYLCDVTYVNNSELGFDYLRDNMAQFPEELVLRDLHYAVVDEVDSILVDEARTPLIISGMPEASTGLYKTVNAVVATLRRGEENDYTADEKQRSVALTEQGTTKVERALGIENLSDPENFELNHIVHTSLKAHALFRRDVDYVVQNGEVVIVDEFTGRLQPGRRYSDGLHQAIEAKENVRVEQERQTVASITYQNFFRLYDKLAGMTGTAKTEEPEFLKIYGMPVVVVPTNLPVRRVDYPDCIYKTDEAKFRAICLEILAMHARGQPVLVGTRSVDVSEYLATRLAPDKLQFQCLARLLQERLRETKAIQGEEREEFEALLRAPLGEVQRHQLRPIAKALGSQMDVLADENVDALATLLGITPAEEGEETPPALPDWRDRLCRALENGIPHNVLNAKYHFKEAEIIAQAGRIGAVTIATNMAGRGVDIVLGGKPEDGQRQTEDAGEVIRLGGLHILGTERHESRRIDNQLRGRSGRQGDPGSSRFYLSLEDELMRLFGPERFGMFLKSWPEEEVLEHRLVTRSIENAQKKVEARNFDIRKHTLQYDDVMNTQRSVIYAERRKVLMGEDLHPTLLDMIPEVCERVVSEHLAPDPETGEVSFDPEQLMEALCRAMPGLEETLDRQRFQKQDQELLIERATDEALKRYAQKEEELGPEVLREVERRALLQVIDTHWMHHLQEMDHLREGVYLRAYGQMDPLIQYQKEASRYFDRLLGQITEDAVRLCFAVQVAGQQQSQRRRQRIRDLQEGTPITEARDEMTKRKPVRVAAKPRRNDPCPCGSGKKYKRCCGAHR